MPTAAAPRRPGVPAELRLALEGRVGRKRVARLLGAAGIVGVHRRRRHGLTRRDPAATQPGPGRAAGHPLGTGSAGVAAITQQRTDQGWLALAVVLDCCSRRVVGWSRADHRRAELVIDAPDVASAGASPPRAWSITPITAARTQPGVRPAAG